MACHSHLASSSVLAGAKAEVSVDREVAGFCPGMVSDLGSRIVDRVSVSSFRCNLATCQTHPFSAICVQGSTWYTFTAPNSVFTLTVFPGWTTLQFGNFSLFQPQISSVNSPISSFVGLLLIAFVSAGFGTVFSFCPNVTVARTSTKTTTNTTIAAIILFFNSFLLC